MPSEFINRTDAPIQEIVDDPEWQSIRQSFLGTWKKFPEQNIQILRQYVFSENPIDYRKFRRVYNYLTGSGFRMGVITHPSIDSLLEDLRKLK